MPQFGFIHDTAIRQPAHFEMFPGAHGQDAPSTLDEYHHVSIDAQASIERTLHEYNNGGHDESLFTNVATVATQSSLDPAHHRFIDTLYQTELSNEQARQRGRQLQGQ